MSVFLAGRSWIKHNISIPARLRQMITYTFAGNVTIHFRELGRNVKWLMVSFFHICICCVVVFLSMNWLEDEDDSMCTTQLKQVLVVDFYSLMNSCSTARTLRIFRNNIATATDYHFLYSILVTQIPNSLYFTRTFIFPICALGASLKSKLRYPLFLITDFRKCRNAVFFLKSKFLPPTDDPSFFPFHRLVTKGMVLNIIQHPFIFKYFLLVHIQTLATIAIKHMRS